MADLSRESERVARDWLCESQGDPTTAPLRYAIRLLLEDAELEVDRLRSRTHEIQEAADKKNAKLQSTVEKHEADRRWAHGQLAALREAHGAVCESEFDRLCILNLRDEWQGEIDRLRAIVDKLLAAIDVVGIGMFGEPTPTGKTWRDARVTWWQGLLAAVEAAEAADTAGGDDG